MNYVNLYLLFFNFLWDNDEGYKRFGCNRILFSYLFYYVIDIIKQNFRHNFKKVRRRKGSRYYR